MSEMDEFLQMFFVECDELLEAVAVGLREMESGTYEMETVHAVFRAVHSIKGGAAAFGLSDLVEFAHKFETALDLIRSDALDVTPQVMPILHRSSDCLSDLVAAARDAGGLVHPHKDELMAELDQVIGTQDDADAAFEFVPTTIDFGDFGDLGDLGPVDMQAGAARHRISLYPLMDLYRSGNDVGPLLRALEKIGSIDVSLDASEVRVLSEWTSVEPLLRWHVTLDGDADIEDIESIFEFVDDCCQLTIVAEGPDQPTPLPDADPLPEVPAVLSAVPPADLPADPPADPPDARPEDGPAQQAAPANTAAQPARTEPPQAAAKSAAKPADGAAPATIRVSLDRVDKLMNMISELVIKEAMLTQVIQNAGLSTETEVVGALDGLRQLAGDIQESVMSIRAQPLKHVFQRMHRILREAADATGKQVRLETIGEQTEVDNTMIERLIDPLTHMIRNSVDHGLEDAVTRQRFGKPQEGRITLSAAHKSGRVQIELHDDGGGIDRDRVRQIAEDKGLISAGATLTSGEIDSLLFLPGFSSKAEVSALSGRGVGLDVVRREIMALGGRIMIASTATKGTTFTITLPLTLAVLEGMLIQLCDQTMVLPITAVQEALRPDAASLHNIGPTGRALSNRGELIPIIDLACVFGLRSQPMDIEEGVLIVVESDSHKRAALRADAIVDQRQVVIKSLEENHEPVLGVSAATILGDGKIALIIDPEALVAPPSSDAGRDRLALAANG